MIVETKVNGSRVTAIAVPEIDRSQLPYIRDGLFEMFTTCLSSEENKDSVHSDSLYFVCLLLKTLAEDIDDNNEVIRIGIHEEEKKGGEVIEVCVEKKLVHTTAKIYSSLIICNAIAGTGLERAAAEALTIRKYCNKHVDLKFNQVILRINEDDTVESICQRYNNAFPAMGNDQKGGES